MIQPNYLFPGANVALVAPASAVPEENRKRAEYFVRSLGLNPVLYPSCYFDNHHGYFAADDEQRAKDIMDAFLDPAIHGIWCIRGGYGCHRLMPLLDPLQIYRNPKWFGGYSDVTALHLFLNQVCGQETFHCPMPSTDFAASLYTMGYLYKALFGLEAQTITYPKNHQVTTLTPGSAEGILCGGNLSLVAASLGTPWEIDTKGKILFLEDIGEKTYRVDAMLTQLRNAGKFQDAAGIVLGAWTDCEPEYPDRTLLLPEIFQELVGTCRRPVLMDFPCGHTDYTTVLPLGRHCVLDADQGTLSISDR